MAPEALVLQSRLDSQQHEGWLGPCELTPDAQHEVTTEIHVKKTNAEHTKNTSIDNIQVCDQPGIYFQDLSPADSQHNPHNPITHHNLVSSYPTHPHHPKPQISNIHITTQNQT